MTAEECYDMGKQLFNSESGSYSALWLREALYKYTEQKLNQPALREQIANNLALALNKQGHTLTALSLANQVIRTNPKNLAAKQNRILFETTLEKMYETGTSVNLTEKSLDELDVRMFDEVNVFLSNFPCILVGG
jgi:squalene cyclase